MICLTVIARDEERCIERCLRSARPFVDDMLVVDTGSRDATAELAAACGARVESFAWCDDFSAARNFSLDHTDAPWRLVLDADEWIESGAEALRALPAATGDFVGEVVVRSGFDDGNAVRHAPCWLLRVLPRGVRFAGRVHEQVVHGLPVRRLGLVLGHDGYRKDQQAGKADRNERLLLRALAESPGDPYLTYQLGKDLEVRGDFAAAAAQYRTACAALGWPPADPARARRLQGRHAWLHDLVVRQIFCGKKTRRYEETQDLCMRQAAWWSHSPDFHFAWGDLLLDVAVAHPGEAAAILAQVAACWQTCLAIGEAPQLEGAVEGRGSVLARGNLELLQRLSAQLPG